MSLKKFLPFILGGMILILILGVFHRQIFQIREITFEGLSWIPQSILEKMVNREESLLSLNREELIQRIMSTGYVEKVLISRKLLNGLVIQVQEKSVVAKLIFQEKNYYLTAKNEILSEKNELLPKKVPVIFLKNKVENARLMWLSAHLEKMKFHDRNFFDKINQISFEDSEGANIFIMDSKKVYVLGEKFKLEDLLRVRYLEGQTSDFGVFDLRGSYVVVKG